MSQFSLPATLTLAEAAAVLKAAPPAASGVGAAQPWAVDAAALKSFDTSALAVLLELRRRVGDGFRISNPPAQLGQLAALYGVGELLGLAASSSAPSPSPSAGSGLTP
jgi:phospholipid transport system transporter-binding protein